MGGARQKKARLLAIREFLSGICVFRTGRGAGTRTLDPLIKSQLLYQLSYTPRVRKDGAGEGTRTLDNHLGKVALYQLSYTRLLTRHVQ